MVDSHLHLDDSAFDGAREDILARLAQERVEFVVNNSCDLSSMRMGAELAKHDIYGGVHYRDNTEFSMYRYAQGTCPHAHEVSQHLITMPLHMYLTREDVERIAEIVTNYVN